MTDMTNTTNIKKKFTQVLFQNDANVWMIDPVMLEKITNRFPELNSAENQKFLNEFVDFLNLSQINEDFEKTFEIFETIYG
jgi:hypothetical protein